MWAYHLRMAWRATRRHRGLSALIVCAIGIGVGVATTMFAIHHGMSSNPIPGKSDQLYAVQLDSWDPHRPYREPDEPPTQLTYRDATALVRAHRATRQVAEFISALTLQPDNPDLKPYQVVSRNTFNDFFQMFDVPFLYGSAWSASADSSAEQVVVLSRETNEKLFGGADSVGREITLAGRRFRVVGVLDHWAPAPKFYDLENDHFGEPEDVYIPFSLTEPMQLHSAGNNSCWGAGKTDTYQGYLNSECVWIQVWVELPTATDREAYHAFLDDYVRGQKALGRFPRPLNNHLRNVTQWLAYNKVVSNDSRALVGLSFLFLAVCMLNAVGLLLARFLRQSGEVALRRALGATRRVMFQQALVEAGLTGVAGGLLGLVLAWFGLAGIQHLLAGSEAFARLDPTVAGLAILTALMTSVAAGLYPAWRTVRIAPATYLKLK
ncbi:MAG: ABC transporter permease [Gammaproteobacteria bacterium]|jgi:putative ABC transport system permease protein